MHLAAEVAEDALGSNEAHKTFIAGEIMNRRAKLLRIQGRDNRVVAEISRHALKIGQASQNGPVIIDSAHVLGFEYYMLARSLKELAEYQFRVIEGIEIENEHYERLTVVGTNLLTLWKGVTYKCLLESDLKAKEYLMDAAKEMDVSSVPVEKAGGAMVLLLSTLFGHFGGAASWVRARSGIDLSELPPNVSALLSPVFRDTGTPRSPP